MENKEIRRANLIKLEAEYKTLEALAVATDTVPGHLSQMKNGTRRMGDKVARRIEQKLGKTPGWMDSIHGNSDAEVDHLVADYAKASPEWQLRLRLLARLSPQQQPRAAKLVDQILATEVAKPYTRRALWNSRHQEGADVQTKRKSSKR